jgi:heat shock protein HslJ
MKHILLFFVAYFIVSNQAVFSQEAKQAAFYSERDVKMMAGVDFYASGDGWSLDIDFEKEIVFAQGKDTIRCHFEKVVQKQKGKITTYKFKASSKEFVVSISTDKCKVAKGKASIGNEVAVVVNDQMHQGCGNYLPDYRLNNIWLVKKINGKELSKLYGPRNQPVVELHLSENTVMGNTGCDEYSGSIAFGNHQIVFGKLTGDQGDCKDANPEKIFKNALSKNTLGYTIEEGLLKLYKNKKLVMVLKPID